MAWLTDLELSVAQRDVIIGATLTARLPDVASNLVMYFLILTGATLHIDGTTNPNGETSGGGCAVRRKGSCWLFTLGLVDTGMLAVPVLAGSAI
jgi:hypothetical protein